MDIFSFIFTARQDEADLKRQKLDYVEITPCLKEVSRIWDEMMYAPGRPNEKFDAGGLISCVKQGWDFLSSKSA